MANKVTRAVFAVPTGSGDYAPEVVYLREQPADSQSVLSSVDEVTILVEAAFPTGAILEVDLLRVGGDPATEAHWIKAVETYTAGDLQALLKLTSWYGVRLRAKSAGTDGNLSVSLAWL